ncbi:MAG: DUF547 domain-containing protein [Chitinophagales bacterium]|nr:DUF547 domain-containing protein [Chitinophagales bacterium]
MAAINAIALSIQLLLATQSRTDVQPIKDELAKISIDSLSIELNDDDVIKTFWINCYNYYVRILIRENSPDLYTQSARTAFFSNKLIVIAGQQLSLNDIEHGMLRHSKIWWSLGYLNKFSGSKFEKQFRVPLDYRIHFALNCGASSCPPVRFYEPDKINDQLDIAMRSFLSAEVKFNQETNTATISQILGWYKGDFGGKNGIKNLLRDEKLIPKTKRVKIAYSTYDWSIPIKEIIL